MTTEEKRRGAFLCKIFVIGIGDRCYECVQDLKTHYGDVRNARARRGLSQIFCCNVTFTRRIMHGHDSTNCCKVWSSTCAARVHIYADRRLIS